MGIPIVRNTKSVVILLLASVLGIVAVPISVDAQLPAEQQIEQRAPPKGPVTVPVFGKRLIAPHETTPTLPNKIIYTEILRIGLGPSQGLRLHPGSDSWNVEPIRSNYEPNSDIYLGKIEFDTAKLKNDFLGSNPYWLDKVAPIHCPIQMPQGTQVDSSPLGNLDAVDRLMKRFRGLERWNNEAYKKLPSDPDVRFIEAEDENGEKNFDRYHIQREKVKEPSQVADLPAGLMVSRT
ncbi:hypothetical protein F5880DRAFT_1609783 [Lentinula raphanica]|nr:hypothetical protein F5880DRAFT_1609783 [Lentinula raphanica]